VGDGSGRQASPLGEGAGERRCPGVGAVAHAAGFSWDRTADGLLRTYRDAVADRTLLPLAVAR